MQGENTRVWNLWGKVEGQVPYLKRERLELRVGLGLCPAHQLLPPPSPAVSTLLTLLPPPVLKCRQFTVAGKHLTVLKGEQIGGSGLG